MRIDRVINQDQRRKKKCISRSCAAILWEAARSRPFRPRFRSGNRTEARSSPRRKTERKYPARRSLRKKRFAGPSSIPCIPRRPIFLIPFRGHQNRKNNRDQKNQQNVQAVDCDIIRDRVGADPRVTHADRSIRSLSLKSKRKRDRATRLPIRLLPSATQRDKGPFPLDLGEARAPARVLQPAERKSSN